MHLMKKGALRNVKLFDKKLDKHLIAIRHGASQTLELFPHGSELFRGKIKLPFKDIFFRSVFRLYLVQEFSPSPLRMFECSFSTFAILDL